MPNLMAQQNPPLIPLLGISVVPYCYISGVPEDTARNITYPETADNQPVFILAKGSPLDPDYTRAFCGFEPFLLELSSHKDLTRFVLIRHFRLGLALP